MVYSLGMPILFPRRIIPAQIKYPDAKYAYDKEKPGSFPNILIIWMLLNYYNSVIQILLGVVRSWGIISRLKRCRADCLILERSSFFHSLVHPSG